jgi:hypothetical protein
MTTKNNHPLPSRRLAVVECEKEERMAKDEIRVRIEATYTGHEEMVQAAEELRKFARDLFLLQALEEMRSDGWDGVLFAEDVLSFVHARDGKSRYGVEEIDVWLKDK